MSATTSGRSAPRAAAPGEDEHVLHRRRDGRVVAEHGHGRRVADEDDVDAGRVREPPARVVVGGDHDDLLAAALHLGELGQRQLARSAGPGGHVEVSFQEDVVDEAGAADPDGGSENEAPVEAGDLDVVGLEAPAAPMRIVRATASACAPVRDALEAGHGARGEARAPHAAPPARGSTLRELSASPSASRTVGRTRIRSSRSRSRAIRSTTAACWASFWPKYARSGRTALKSLRQIVATPRKWPGRAVALHACAQLRRPRPRSGSPPGTSPPTGGEKSRSTPLLARRARRRDPHRAGNSRDRLRRRTGWG